MVAATTTPKADALAPYVVTRALCMGGERVEVGTVIELPRVQATELMSANKIAPYVAPEPEPVPVLVPDSGKADKPKATKPAPAEPVPDAG